MQRLRFLLLSIAAMSAFIIYVTASTTDPQTIESKIRALMYLCIFFFILSITSFVRIGLAARSSYHPFTVAESLPLIRQGAILGVVVCTLLSLQALRILSFGDALLIIAAAILLELFFRVRIPIAKVQSV